MDRMWIDKKAALHVVDLDTNFSSASFFRTQTVENFRMHSYHTENPHKLVFQEKFEWIKAAQ